MSNSPAAVLFDVDGTLIDSNYLHVVTWWQAFAQVGRYVPMARIHRAIGMGTDQLLDELLPADRDVSADKGISSAHLALYATYWSRLRPIPGAAALLRGCKKRGLRVILATSAGEPEIKVLRAALDADDAIDDAVSAAEVEHSKPAPDLIEVALRKSGVRPAEAVFVGDTVWDLRACQRAGVGCISLLSGGIGRDELAAAGAVEIFAGPGELLESLADSLIGR